MAVNGYAFVVGRRPSVADGSHEGSPFPDPGSEIRATLLGTQHDERGAEQHDQGAYQACADPHDTAE